VEGVVLVVATAALTSAIFEWGWPAFVYAPIVLLVVIAFRIGTTAVAITSALVAFAAAGETAEAEDFWRSVDVSAANRLLFLQLALGVVIAAALLLAAEVAGRERMAVELVRAEGDRAAALERARLFEAEHAARERAELLERHASDLAFAATELDVARATVAALASAGIPVANVHAVRWSEGREPHLAILAATGLSEGSAARWATYSLDGDTLSASVIRSGRAAEIRSGAEYEERHPGSAELRREQGGESYFAVPLRASDDRVHGALAAVRCEPGGFDDATKGLITALAEQTSLALERARLLERERIA